MSWPLEHRLRRYDLALSALVVALAGAVYLAVEQRELRAARAGVATLQAGVVSATSAGLPVPRARRELHARAARCREAYLKLAEELAPEPPGPRGVAGAVRQRAEAERLAARLPRTVRAGLQGLPEDPARMRLLRSLLDALSRAGVGAASIRQLVLPAAGARALEGALLERVVRHPLVLQLELPGARLPGLLDALARTRRPRLFVLRMALATAERRAVQLTLELLAVAPVLGQRVVLPRAEHDEDEGWDAIGPTVRRDW